MFHYADKYGESMARLSTLMASGALKVQVDNGKHLNKPLQGLDGVFDGVDVSRMIGWLWSHKEKKELRITH